MLLPPLKEIVRSAQELTKTKIKNSCRAWFIMHWLGLSLVKRYMELMNGSVWFERPEGDGAEFVIELEKA